MKNKVKKIIAVFLVSVMAFSLSGCGLLENFSLGNIYNSIFGGKEAEDENAQAASSDTEGKITEILEEEEADDSALIGTPDKADEFEISFEVEVEAEGEAEVEAEVEAETENEPENVIEAETEIGEISEPEKEAVKITPDLKATASSIYIEKGEDYDPKALLDGDINTAWIEGVDGTGAGEWVKFETKDGSQFNLTALEFNLGFQRTERLLKNNGWPTRVLLEFEGGYTEIAEFDSVDAPAIITLREPVNTSFIKITILEAVKGAKYADTAITDIAFFGVE